MLSTAVTMFGDLAMLAQSNNNAGAAVGAGFAGLFMCVFALIGLLIFAIWLWMLIDCCTRDFEGNEKIVWILVIVFTGIIGALVYMFVGKSRGTKS
ncbi:PLDc N-terminal domain-containing protein [Poriferisphaera sp. WC338]|uniref:PLDc N-terminal domain-containing protein n=1 Tax=Poriferisphaera sp. WC338 TaxID=3425129 RepID=UPI003D81BD8C